MLRGITRTLRSRRWLSSAPSDGGPTAIGQHIERLVGELADVKEGESIHLDRLRAGLARQSIDVAVLSLEKELHQEMASALGRSGRTIDLRCLQLELAQQALAKGTGTKDAVIAAHGRAMTARQELIIHRVAIGMRGAHQTELVEEMWPLEPLTVADKNAAFRSSVTEYLRSHGIESIPFFRSISQALHRRRGIPADIATLDAHIKRIRCVPNRHLRRAAEQRQKLGAVFCMLEAVDAYARGEVEVEGEDEDEDEGAHPPTAPTTLERTEELQTLFTDVVSELLLHLEAEKPAEPLAAVRSHLLARVGVVDVAPGVSSPSSPSPQSVAGAPGVLLFVAAHGAIGETPAQGQELTQAGREQMNAFGSWLKDTYPALGFDGKGHQRLARGEDIYARSLRFWPALFSCEAIVHGICGLEPMPTNLRRSRLEMAYNWNDMDGDGLRYEMPIASSGQWNAQEWAPRINIFSSRLPADTDVMLNGGAITARGGARGTVVARGATTGFGTAQIDEGAALMLSELHGRLARAVASPAAQHRNAARALQHVLRYEKVPELKERCRVAALRVGGSRSELVARLLAHATASSSSSSSSSGASAGGGNATSADEEAHEMARPWQAAPALASLQVWVGAESIVRKVAANVFGGLDEQLNLLGEPLDETSVAIAIELLDPLNAKTPGAALRGAPHEPLPSAEGFAAQLMLCRRDGDGPVRVVARRILSLDAKEWGEGD